MSSQIFGDGEYKTKGDYHVKLDPNWSFYLTYLAKLEYVRKFLGQLPKDNKILDVGCGEGVLVKEYREKGYNIEGLDINYSSEFVKRGSVLSIPWVDDTFNTVLCLDVVEHLSFAEQKIALREISRVLISQGKVLMSIPNLAHLLSRIKFLFKGELVRTASIEKHPGDRAIKEYIKVIEDSGFVISERKGLTLTVPFLHHRIIGNPNRYGWLYNTVNKLFAYPNLCFLNMLILQNSR